MNGRRSKEPLYLKVRDALAQELAQGHYAPGAALPNERELAAAHSVSIGTLRTAVDALVAEGMLIRQQGKGTYAAQHDRDRLRFYFFHVVEHDADSKRYPDVGLVSFAVEKADATVAAKLNIERGAKAFHLRNLIRLNAQPTIVDDIWLDAQRFRGLTEATVCNRPSTLYQLYQANFGLTVVRSLERLRAVSCPAASAKLLGVPTNAPVLAIRRQAVAYDGTPIEWRVSTVNTALHEYTNDLSA
jgi:GntR family transcriptional regulator